MVTMGVSQGRPPSDCLPSPLQSRIEECRQLRDHAITQEEKDAWFAEEVGLLDAFFGVDRTEIQRHCHPYQFERYVLGLLDGQTIMRVFTCGGTGSGNDGGSEPIPYLLH